MVDPLDYYIMRISVLNPDHQIELPSRIINTTFNCTQSCNWAAAPLALPHQNNQGPHYLSA